MPNDKPQVDRRTFLTAGGIAAATAAATLAAGAASAQEAEQSGAADPARPLAGEAAFITGGARGIGRAAAVELAKLGANVALFDIATPDAIPALPYPLAEDADLQETVRLIEAEGVTAVTFTGDVRDLAALEQAVAGTVEAFGRLDIVYANAGIGLGTDTLEVFDPEVFSTVMAVNTVGVANTIKAVSGSIATPGGRIIVTTSREGREASGSFAYSTSKWGAVAVMKNAARELGPLGIAVNGVAPGACETTMIYRAWGGEATDERRDTMNENVSAFTALPVGMIETIDVARAVAFLAGPGARYMTGATIDVNGGRTAYAVV